MVVDDFHIFRTRHSPTEADAKLIVDTDAVLFRTVTPERFKSISRWYPQVFQLSGDLQLTQFAAGNRLDIGKPLDPMAAGQLSSVSVLERNNHVESITPCVINVKRDYRSAHPQAPAPDLPRSPSHGPEPCYN